MKGLAVLLFLLSFESVAQCAHPQQNGTLIFTSDTVSTCSGYWMVPAAEYSAYVSSGEITVTDVTASFLWGFGVVVTFSGLAFSVGLAKRLISKI